MNNNYLLFNWNNLLIASAIHGSGYITVESVALHLTKHGRCARPQELKLWPCSAFGTLRARDEAARNVAHV